MIFKLLQKSLNFLYVFWILKNSFSLSFYIHQCVYSMQYSYALICVIHIYMYTGCFSNVITYLRGHRTVYIEHNLKKIAFPIFNNLQVIVDRIKNACILKRSIFSNDSKSTTWEKSKCLERTFFNPLTTGCFLFFNSKLRLWAFLLNFIYLYYSF